MKSLFAPIALLASLTVLVHGQLTINTPTNVVVCQPILLTWGGGTRTILPGSQPGAAALQTFPSTSSDSVTWVANIAAGTSIGLTIRDSTGATASSAPFPINSGSDTSCVGQTSSATGSSTGTSTGSTGTPATSPTAGATTPSTGTTTRTSTTSPATTPGTTTRPTTTGSSTSTAASTSTTNAASAHGYPIGAAGFIGAAVIALMA